MQNMNQMSLLSQIDNFRKSVNGNPEEIVRNMVQSGRVSQRELDEAQKTASQILQMFNVHI